MDLGQNLLRFNLEKRKFIVLDTETEGLNLLRSRPWEIAWAIYHGKEKQREYQYFLKWPNLKVTEGAAKATGFKKENIEMYGKDPKEIIDLFNKDLYNPEYSIVAANILGFDNYIVNLSRKSLGYKTDYSYIDRVYDTAAISRAYRLGIKIPADKNDFIPFQYRVLSIIQKDLKTKNSEMAQEFGMTVDLSKVHGAQYDIDLTFFVFTELANKMDLI